MAYAIPFLITTQFQKSVFSPIIRPKIPDQSKKASKVRQYRQRL